MNERIINAKKHKKMITFDQLWQLLYDHGASNYHKHDCCELWDSLTPEQQDKLQEVIAGKLRERRFVDYNPLRAMQDNLRLLHQQVAPPKNYNGSREFEAMVQTGALCTAEYNGAIGIYTLDDAKRYNMTIIKRLTP